MTTSSSLLIRLLRHVNTLSLGAAWASGALTLCSVLLICFDVFARKFLGFNTGGADELSGYAFAISISWSLAFVVLHRGNVRVDALYHRFPVRFTAFLDWLSLAVLGVFLAYLTYYASQVAGMSWEMGAVSNSLLGVPLWIPQGLWVLGFVWMCVVLALMLLRASAALVTGDIAAIKELCGVRTTEEEASDEAESGARIVESEKS
ncbi:MAG: TRAP transporter small permease [Candidatus Accumulibacter sp.]|jgi:TRAP-type C4-dicarboxylate transport system permease small subunit|nr:TRAP transporter small permease [Accumulibacter sp.]